MRAHGILGQGKPIKPCPDKAGPTPLTLLLHEVAGKRTGAWVNLGRLFLETHQRLDFRVGGRGRGDMALLASCNSGERDEQRDREWGGRERGRRGRGRRRGEREKLIYLLVLLSTWKYRD